MSPAPGGEWYSHAPSGWLWLEGKSKSLCTTNIEYATTRVKRSGRNQAMAIAAAPPEEQPSVILPAGSDVIFRPG